MSSSQPVKAISRIPTDEELFYQDWGRETLKANIGIATEVLKQLITINVALLGGGAAFLEGSDVGSLSRALILFSFFVGLIVSLLGVMPTESKVDIRIPKEVKRHKSKALNRKRLFLGVSAGFTIFGLLVASLVVSGVTARTYGLITEILQEVLLSNELITLITMIGTLLSAIGALVAAYAAMKSTKTWKESQRFDSRSKAVQAWVGEAAAFRGRLKFIYKEKLGWPADQKEIEYISGSFWSWVALWPSVKASLDGDLRKQAELLWGDVHNSYNALMSSEGSLEQLGKSVQAVYNSDLLSKVLENKS